MINFLHIKIEDGVPVGHPALDTNIIGSLGTMPTTWETFLRVEPPELTAYQILLSDTPSYSKVGGVWTDVWSVTTITDAAKIAMQQKVKDDWATISSPSNFSTWVFDEDLCTFIPPIPEPQGTYKWSGIENTWKLYPPMPEGCPVFDYVEWSWVAPNVGV